MITTKRPAHVVFQDNKSRGKSVFKDTTKDGATTAPIPKKLNFSAIFRPAETPINIGKSEIVEKKIGNERKLNVYLQTQRWDKLIVFGYCNK